MFSKVVHGFLTTLGFFIGLVIESLPTAVAFLIAYFFLKWLEMC